MSEMPVGSATSKEDATMRGLGKASFFRSGSGKFSQKREQVKHQVLIALQRGDYGRYNQSSWRCGKHIGPGSVLGH